MIREERMLVPHEEMVTISKKEYESLKDDARWRECVEYAGVDNWIGYECAMEEYWEGKDS